MIGKSKKDIKQESNGYIDSCERSRLLSLLYAARLSTIDRYRVPITDRGLYAAFRSAMDEAMIALDVYREMISGGNKK